MPTSGRTGETCQVSGVYRCQTHSDNTIPLAKGDQFPPMQQRDRTRNHVGTGSPGLAKARPAPDGKRGNSDRSRARAWGLATGRTFGLRYIRVGS